MKPVVAEQPSDQAGAGLLLAAVVAAVGWMVCLVFVGVDFTDEMQYYGEIESLTRTGKLFQSDLFIQQFGYVFLVPFFRLHALLFPDLDFLVLAGRGLLFAGYAVAGWLIWRASHRFTRPARLAALALHFAWVPFQLFAPSYNTMSHLLIIGLAAGWLRRAGQQTRGGLIGLAAGLGVLGFVHPPAGVVVALLLAILIWRREGFQAAWHLGLWTLGIAGVILVGIRLWHGPDFFADLMVAVEFSRAHSVAHAISHPPQYWGLIGFLAAGAMFLGWHRARAAGRNFLGAYPALPVAAVTALGLLYLLRSLWMKDWMLGYVPSAILLFLIVVLSVWLGGTRSQAGGGLRWLAMAGLAGSGLLWLLEAVYWGTGFLAIGVFFVLLAGLAVSDRPVDRGTELAVFGLITGTLFAVTSGNGLHNFGVGCAAIIPFLAARLCDALRFEGVRPAFVRLPLVLLPVLMVLHGMKHPYREVRGLTGFAEIQGVPAFRGLRASAEKLTAIALFRGLQAGEDLQSKKVLVIGPQPWIYFVSRGVPATPMLFMHFDGIPAVEQILADRLFQTGDPDYIVVTNVIPAPVHARVTEWMERGSTMVHVPVPPVFKSRYENLTAYMLGDHLILLTRTPRQP